MNLYLVNEELGTNGKNGTHQTYVLAKDLKSLDSLWFSHRIIEKELVEENVESNIVSFIRQHEILEILDWIKNKIMRNLTKEEFETFWDLAPDQLSQLNPMLIIIDDQEYKQIFWGYEGSRYRLILDYKILIILDSKNKMYALDYQVSYGHPYSYQIDKKELNRLLKINI